MGRCRPSLSAVPYLRRPRAECVLPGLMLDVVIALWVQFRDPESQFLGMPCRKYDHHLASVTDARTKLLIATVRLFKG